MIIVSDTTLLITKEDVIASLQIIRETRRFSSDRLIKELMTKINNL
jgi:hypothetical protein